jgi:hypothetical protein
VTSAHKLVADVPADVPAGPHRVVVIIDEAVTTAPASGPWNDLVLTEARWPKAGAGLRREDIYGDDSR